MQETSRNSQSAHEPAARLRRVWRLRARPLWSAALSLQASAQMLGIPSVGPTPADVVPAARPQRAVAPQAAPAPARQRCPSRPLRASQAAPQQLPPASACAQSASGQRDRRTAEAEAGAAPGHDPGAEQGTDQDSGECLGLPRRAPARQALFRGIPLPHRGQLRPHLRVLWPARRRQPASPATRSQACIRRATIPAFTCRA